MEFIDLKTQYRSLKEKIDNRINNVLLHGQYIMGPEVEELENTLADYTGSRYCIAVSSGTDALLISLMAIGLKEGDEVLTTPFTFISTAEVIALLGAKPVFVDVDPETGNINANLLETAITKKTKAIIPVSLYGQPADMDEINTIAAKYKLTVIEDAAQSFGAEYKGKKSCNLSTIGCTSFFPSKPLGCYGDGGAIFTSDKKIATACRQIRIHGQSERYCHTRIGVGGRIDTIQCAVLLAKMDNFQWELEQRKIKAEKYDSSLNGISDEKGISILKIHSDRSSAYGQYTILCMDRDKVKRILENKKIPYAVHYPIAINEQPAYQKYGQSNKTPVAKSLTHKVLSLPIGPYLSEEDQSDVINTILEK